MPFFSFFFLCFSALLLSLFSPTDVLFRRFVITVCLESILSADTISFKEQTFLTFFLKELSTEFNVPFLKSHRLEPFSCLPSPVLTASKTNANMLSLKRMLLISCSRSTKFTTYDASLAMICQAQFCEFFDSAKWGKSIQKHISVKPFFHCFPKTFLLVFKVHLLLQFTLISTKRHEQGAACVFVCRPPAVLDGFQWRHLFLFRGKCINLMP